MTSADGVCGSPFAGVRPDLRCTPPNCTGLPMPTGPKASGTLTPPECGRGELCRRVRGNHIRCCSRKSLNCS